MWVGVSASRFIYSYYIKLPTYNQLARLALLVICQLDRAQLSQCFCVICYHLTMSTAHQQEQINSILELVRTHAPNLVEMDGDTKWTTGNIVFKYPDYKKEGDYVFMVGALKSGKTTFHLMPLYGVPGMAQKYSQELKSFAAGKSCINFKNYADLPEAALIDIIKTGTPLFKEVYERHKGEK